jgi:hypothetical protein
MSENTSKRVTLTISIDGIEESTVAIVGMDDVSKLFKLHGVNMFTECIPGMARELKHKFEENVTLSKRISDHVCEGSDQLADLSDIVATVMSTNPGDLDLARERVKELSDESDDALIDDAILFHMMSVM